MSSPNLLDLTLPELGRFFESIGERSFRAKQVFAWIYRRDVLDISQMTDLSAALRGRLEGIATVRYDAPVAVAEAKDGTIKLGFRAPDGAAYESVIIPDGERQTLCLSSQTGCAMGCAFCHTASIGAGRDLTPSEFLGQVLAARKLTGPDRRITNIVFMGMGEPLANLANLQRAISTLTDDHAFNVARRKITVSTVGLSPEIEELGRTTESRLAVSLNATTDKVRSQIMPVNRRYPLERLIRCLQTYPLGRRDRVTLEYVLLAGVNDSPEDARRLVRIVRRVPSKVNLIPYNEHDTAPFRRPSEATIERFQSILVEGRVAAIRRTSRGEEILAACGQLAARELQAPDGAPDGAPEENGVEGDPGDGRGDSAGG